MAKCDDFHLLEFLTIEALNVESEMELTHGTLHKTFLEGELYALDRVRSFVKENLKDE